MSLELDLGNIDDAKNAIRLKDNMDALKYLLDSIYLGETINSKLIIDVASIINKSSLYISNDYRKIGTILDETNIPISNPENIKSDMQNLLYKYFNEWNNIDIFEREARFHIEFIRIHPFEDGNGRTSRLLLNFNLLKNGIAPVIITNDLIDYYHDYIKNYDINGMKKLFYIQSVKENSIIKELYDNYKLEINRDNKIILIFEKKIAILITIF